MGRREERASTVLQSESMVTASSSTSPQPWEPPHSYITLSMLFPLPGIAFTVFFHCGDELMPQDLTQILFTPPAFFNMSKLYERLEQKMSVSLKCL